MKKSLTGKSACIALLAALLIISLADVLLRATVFEYGFFDLFDYGEVFTTIAFTTLLIILALKNKDRLFYAICGIWLGYFVLCQLFALPEEIATLVEMFTYLDDLSASIVSAINSAIVLIIDMIVIGVLGALLIKYIYNGKTHTKTFGLLCLVSILMQVIYSVLVIGDIIGGMPSFFILSVFYSLSRIAMVCLLAVFAHSTARLHIAKNSSEE